MMALRASGESGRPDLAPCSTIMSTRLLLMALPFTVATAGPFEAAAAESAVLSALHAPRASNEAALAARIPFLINLIYPSPRK